MTADLRAALDAQFPWGSQNPSDIRTFYRSELDYLRAMKRRYACQWCGTSAMSCPSCIELDDRIEALARVQEALTDE